MTITYFNYLWDIDGISAGSAVKAKEFIAALRRLGHTAHLEWRTPQPKNQNGFGGKNHAGMKPRLQPYLHEPKRLVNNFRHLSQEYFLLKRQKPDVFFNRLEFYYFSGSWLSRLLNLPLVVEADCPPTFEHNTFYGKDYLHLGKLPARIELANLRAADAVIVISNVLKNYYIEHGIPAGKMHVIPNAADPQKFRPLPRDREFVQKYNLAGKTVVGWVGALVGWTGIENLIAAARQVLATRPQVSFMMVGGGPNQELMRKELQTGEYAARVILPGTVPHEEVPRYLSCMDVVLAPYPKLDFWYASSMKIFEYMAAGKAVLASAVGQIAEVINDGVNGYLFDPDSGAELVQKITALADSAEARQRVSERARRDVEHKWNWEANAKKMIEIFEEVLQRRRAHAAR
ncbi:glycosyltransferase family 1 protein [candidate division KSB1 bacterium]|nr:MAG: glycosyltransferase family 1 protein [candidate division KSB1 bacterium]MBC6947250.1 glycosyltransferase family 1 protein [candidate division KSB1 bacterium]MCE7944048.1 glycosyltransferase family 1 protein [Chlorobi bacterium CHB1]MDL1874056.1 glycosyltransferase family 4 protein [Cytophagia bacterium CHB2]